MNIAFPHAPGKGGPGSFQIRIENELKIAGWNIVYPEDKVIPDIVLVVGGTRKLLWLWKMKRLGVPVLYRLDGIAWIHKKVKGPLFVYFSSEIRNLLTQIIRFAFADILIYQSKFVQSWWEKYGWKVSKKFVVIHNGVDLRTFKFSPVSGQRPHVLCMEGTLDYSPYAVHLINNVNKRLNAAGWSLVVYGGFQDTNSKQYLDSTVDYRGYISRDELPKIFENSVYLSLDVNPACPNTVIEALASGSPVVAYNTGALSELVEEGAGRIVDYGSDPWELGYPDEDKLFENLLTVLNEWETYSMVARRSAEKRFDIRQICSAYMSIIKAAITN